MSELTFEQMLEESLKTIRNGEVVDGTVIDVKPDEIVLNIGYKADGIITRSEYTNDSNADLTTMVSVGDPMTVKVLKVNDGEGQVLLTYKRLAAEKGNERLKEAYENHEVLKAPVTQILGGGLSVVVDEARVFIPASLVSDTYEKDLSKYQDQEIEFVISEFNPRRNRVIGDRRQLLVAEKAEKQKELFEKLHVGDTVEGVVKNVTDFGAFIDIVKPFKKDLHVDAKYLSNSLNQSLTSKMYYYRGFYLMFVPVFVMIMLFNYWPMLGVRYSFTKYVIANPYYIGLYHFQTMFTNDIYFWQAFRNTLILSLIKLFLNTGAAVIISLLLNEITNMIFKKTVQTIIYLPHFMSWVVVASVFKMLLAPYDTAPVNSILINMGAISNPIDFMNSTTYWRGTFYIMNVWKDTGWGTILFLATLSGISPDLYEAAQIDGANRFKRLIYITLPALANTIITVFILNLAKVMNLFESVFVLQSPITYAKSQVLQTYVYTKTFSGGNSDYGYTTAVGLFKSFVGMILVLGCNWASKKVRGRGIV